MTKAAWRDKVKVERGCKKCGYNAHPNALDFHHRPGVLKLFTLGGPGFANRSWAAIEEEIEKCDVLCANCHRIETSTLKSSL